MLFLKLFIIFTKIGTFNFGGGYAMLSLIHNETVVKNQWLSNAEFTDIVAISQSTPGPIGINSATYVGYSSLVNAGYEPYWGVLGSLIATVAVVLPSFVLMVVVSKFLMKYKSHKSVESVFQGLRPAVVGLLAAAALLLTNEENFGSMSSCPWRFWISVGIFLFAFIAQKVYKMSPILVIILCGVTGLILF